MFAASPSISRDIIRQYVLSLFKKKPWLISERGGLNSIQYLTSDNVTRRIDDVCAGRLDGTDINHSSDYAEVNSFINVKSHFFPFVGIKCIRSSRLCFRPAADMLKSHIFPFLVDLGRNRRKQFLYKIKQQLSWPADLTNEVTRETWRTRVIVFNFQVRTCRLFGFSSS